MSDFRLQSDFLHHHKVRRLRARLGPDGVLAWLGLIGYAATNKPDGRLAGLNNEDIALVAGWVGEHDFTTVLHELRLLDRHGKTFSLHNWSKRQPWVTASEQRRTKARKAASVRWEKRETLTPPMTSTNSDGNAQGNATSIDDECSEHAQGNAPYLTLPNLTQPKSGALFGESQKSKPKQQKKPDLFEQWFTKSLLPAFPAKGQCQQDKALRFLRKERPSQAVLDAYLAQAAKWAPVWIQGDWYPGFHSFLTDGKYRQAPDHRADRNGKAPAALPPTADEFYRGAS